MKEMSRRVPRMTADAMGADGRMTQVESPIGGRICNGYRRKAMNNDVLLDISDGIGLVTLNRPDALNTFNYGILDGLGAAYRQCDADDAVRVVVVTGAGRAFCAGIDLSRFGKPADGQQGSSQNASMTTGGAATLAERTHGLANRPQQAAWVWHEMPVPVIAAVHGVAFGGGEKLGWFATIAIAIHNIPEGLAIALVCIPKGMKVRSAALWAIFSNRVNLPTSSFE